MNEAPTTSPSSTLPSTHKPLELAPNDLHDLSNEHTADDTTIIEIKLNDSKIVEFNGGSDIELVLLNSVSNPDTNTKAIYLDYLAKSICPIFIYPIIANKLNDDVRP